MSNTIMAAIYNHYMATYAPARRDASLDTHKKGELKDICRNIQKMNKEAPLYILDRSDDTKFFAISLKENARQLQATILQTAGVRHEELFKNNIAYSSNEDILSAEYLGSGGSTEDIPTHAIAVHSLATPQVNVGHFLPSYDLKLESGNYSFGVNVGGMGYEFQFSVKDGDTNYDIQQKLCRLVNHGNIGLNASLVEGMDNAYALRIASNKTGSNDEVGGAFRPTFSVFDLQDGEGKGPVSYLGIDYVMNPATNARFSVDGVEKSSASNHFSIGKDYLVNLYGITGEDEEVTVGVKTNTESLKHNVRSLIGGYNSFLQTMGEYDSRLMSSGKLVRELGGITRLYRNELDAIGISRSADGSLAIDDSLLDQAAGSEEVSELMAPLGEFSFSLYEKSENVSRDPLNYANKVIVAYKNPGKNFPAPYAGSSYSGLLFNYYC